MLVPFFSLFFSISHTWIHSNPKIEIKQDSILDKIIMTRFVFHLLYILYFYWNQFFRWKFTSQVCSHFRLKIRELSQTNKLKFFVLTVTRIEMENLKSTQQLIFYSNDQRNIAYAFQFERKLWRLECILVSI